MMQKNSIVSKRMSYVLTFGIHRGERLSQVPLYSKWLAGYHDLRDRLYCYVPPDKKDDQWRWLLDKQIVAVREAREFSTKPCYPIADKEYTIIGLFPNDIIELLGVYLSYECLRQLTLASPRVLYVLQQPRFWAHKARELDMKPATDPLSFFGCPKKRVRKRDDSELIAFTPSTKEDWQRRVFSTSEWY